MSELSPNERQQRLIDGTDGLYLVDAGAGTGKTFTVTRRYANIVEQEGVTPEDVLLVTFTNNAAAEMRERIVSESSYSVRELADAPIQTFHSLAHDLLDEHGHTAPTHLGIDDRITGSTRIIEDELVEDALFREFIGQFVDTHPEYDPVVTAISDTGELLGIITELAAKGVFPEADGWYRDGKDHLDGDFEAFERLFEEANQPQNGGSRQSDLRSTLNRYGTNKTYLPEAPEKSEIRGDGKQVPHEVARQAFEEDRTALISFLHDVYHGYLSFALRRNYLNFGFLQLFAFVLLCEDHTLRERIGYDYVMVDEFQDSSEIQFKLTLLLAGTNNICVVGDWKQSIYSFQYADVENIREFERRIDRFSADLNTDADRVRYDTAPVSRLRLETNYRSTQSILDFSEHALTTPATGGDDPDVAATEDAITSLDAATETDNTVIEALQSDAEQEAILAKIEEIIGNERYAVEGEDGEYRPPTYGDIAVLTRTRDFGRELLDTAEAYDLPLAYEGGIEVFRTDAAKLLLAWLRILERDADRGWALVLEEAGYTIDEVDHVLDADAYPESMLAFRDRLAGLETFGGIARRVFERYDCTGPTADVVLHTVQSVFETTTLTRGDLIGFIERAIDAGSTHEVHAGAGTDSVTVQTIHATKGLEYPLVILANMNANTFPSTGGSGGDIRYIDPLGLRQRKRYSAEAHDVPHVYDNWHADVLRWTLPQAYDEERRLLYVAITRAESHVLFTAGSDPNTFIQELPVSVESVESDLSTVSPEPSESSPFDLDISVPEGPASFSPHTFIDESVFETGSGGRGMAFGTRVHEFAEAYLLGKNVTPDGEDEANLKRFLDSLSGATHPEEDAFLPLDVDGERTTISGVIDLLHVTPDRAGIIDYKTDLNRQAESEYRKQLSVYYHVVSALYPERTVTMSIFYTAAGDRVEIEPLGAEQLRELVRETAATG